MLYCIYITQRNIKKFGSMGGFMHTRVVRQYESVAGYVALVTSVVLRFKLKRIQRALFHKYFLQIIL